MEDSNCSVSISSLICQEEDHTIFDDDGEEMVEKQCQVSLQLDDPFLSETEEEYIEILVSKESSSIERRHLGFFCSEDSSVVNDSWLRWARSDAIQWITKTTNYFGFSSQTAYLAVTYFDQFLMRRSIDKGKSWVVQLLSVGCLSLAAKMEEYVVPALSEYHVEECCFDGPAIQRMELLILSTLEWRMSSVTPFSYLKYFLDKLQIKNNLKELLSLAIRFISAIVEEINLLDFRPSAIAAAAILAASNQRLTKKLVESKLSIFYSCGTLETEHVFTCYSLMTRDSPKIKSIASDSLVSSELSKNCSSSGSTSFDIQSNKRRRLQLAHTH